MTEFQPKNVSFQTNSLCTDGLKPLTELDDYTVGNSFPVDFMFLSWHFFFIHDKHFFAPTLPKLTQENEYSTVSLLK